MTLPARCYRNHAPTSTGLCVFNVPPSPGQRQAVGPAPATAPGLARTDGRRGLRGAGPSPSPRRGWLARVCPRGPAAAPGQPGHALRRPRARAAAASPGTQASDLRPWVAAGPVDPSCAPPWAGRGEQGPAGAW